MLKEKSKKTKKIEITKIIIFGVFLLLPLLYLGEGAKSQDINGNGTVEGLNEDIKGIKDKIKDLEAQKEDYEDRIDQLRDDRFSLSREIDILDNRIAQKLIEIDTEQAKIDQSTLEIQVLGDEIIILEKDIALKTEQLSLVLDKLNREGAVDYFQIFLQNTTFATFFDAVKNLEDIQADIFQIVIDVKDRKESLGVQQQSLEERKLFQEESKLTLEERRATLEGQQDTKLFLVVETRYSERRFQGLVEEIRREQEQANLDILNLESEVRDRLERDKLLETLGGDEEFIWPVASRVITARFHDPTYPYRYIFEHPAIDIAVDQGTKVRATKSGYVGRAKDAGLGYSYVLIIHDEGISSVYGHLSDIQILEDNFIVQGQVIGLSGGAPGTLGAGKFSTGSHLHFELRQNGIPLNPENFL